MVNPSVFLNGKVSYVSAAFLANSPTGSATLHAAALSRPSAPATFILPSSVNATTAAGTIVPPESDSTGAFANYGADVRGARSNALSWYNVLYPNLANPVAGYPITGTTQILLSTCYKSNNVAAIKNLVGWNTNDLSHDRTGADRTGIFTQKLLGASNISAMPPLLRSLHRDRFVVSIYNGAIKIDSPGEIRGCLSFHWQSRCPTAGIMRLSHER